MLALQVRSALVVIMIGGAVNVCLPLLLCDRPLKIKIQNTIYSIYGTILYEGMWTYDPVVSEF